MPIHRHSKWFTLVGILFLCGVFILEVTQHMFFTVAYIAIAGLAFLYAQKIWQYTVIAVITSVLMITGYFTVTGWITEFDQLAGLLNRGLALLLIWMAIYFTLRYRKYQADEIIQRQEIQERILVEQQLKISEHTYKAIARNFPEGWIGLLDDSLTYVFAEGSGQCMNGLPAVRLTGRKFTDSLQQNREEADRFLRDALCGREVTFEIICNGRTFEVNAVPFESGQPNQRLLIVVHDIHTLKKTENELMKALDKERQLGEMKTRFVSLASHEFRTPLTTILSSAFLLESYTGDKYESNKAIHLGRIKRSVKILTEILNDFLSLGKLEEGEIKPQLSEFNLHEFLLELEREVEPLRRSQQKLTIHYRKAAHIVSDKQVLRNILYNLISNAFKYTSTEDEVLLDVDVVDDKLVVSVCDHGMGIPEDEQPYIFKRFYRAQNAFNIQGTGLGLNIVKRYINLLNGTIGFTSIPYEKTVFTVSLPVKITEEVTPEPMVV
jgi:signal transduction histidine kinase